jgi:hypothetical protein
MGEASDMEGGSVLAIPIADVLEAPGDVVATFEGSDTPDSPHASKRSAQCTVCQRPDIEDVDAALDSGESLGSAGRRFGIPKATLGGHSLNHRDRDAAKMIRAASIFDNLGRPAGEYQDQGRLDKVQDLFDRSEQVLGRALAMLETSMAMGNLTDGLRAVKEVRETLSFIGKNRGWINDAKGNDNRTLNVFADLTKEQLVALAKWD